MENVEQVSEAPTEVSTESSAPDIDFGGIDKSLLASMGIDVESVPKGHHGLPEEVEAELEATEEVDASAEGETDESESEGQEAEGNSKVWELTHNGQKISLDEKQLIENAQKGYDYTVKTMKLSEERKAFEEEHASKLEEYQKLNSALSEKQNELQEIVTLKNQWDYYINSLEKSDPDLYDSIVDGFNSTTKHFSNPIINAQLEQMNSVIDNLQKQASEREYEQIRSQFEHDFSKSEETWKDTFDSLGLKMDKSKVKKAYADGHETVDDAIKAIYSGDIIKLYQSKNKVQQVKNKVQGSKSVPKAGSAKSVGKVEKPAIGKKTSYNDIAGMVLRGQLK